jgi:hypothetical protein
LKKISSGFAALVAIGALVLVTACSSTSAGPSTITTKHPTPTASETTSALPTPEPIEIPASLVTYQSMSVDEFGALPWNERLLYWPWLARDMDAFVDEYIDATDMPANEIGQLPAQPASASSSVLDAVTFGVWANRLALSLDGDDARKALLIAFPDGGSNYANMVAFLEEVQAAGQVGEGQAAWMQGANGLLPMLQNVQETSRGSGVIYFTATGARTEESYQGAARLGTFVDVRSG